MVGRFKIAEAVWTPITLTWLMALRPSVNAAEVWSEGACAAYFLKVRAEGSALRALASSFFCVAFISQSFAPSLQSGFRAGSPGNSGAMA